MYLEWHSTGFLLVFYWFSTGFTHYGPWESKSEIAILTEINPLRSKEGQNGTLSFRILIREQMKKWLNFDFLVLKKIAPFV